MSDIVARLRESAARHEWETEPWGCPLVTLCDDAAAEIERLRAEVAGQRDGEAQEIVTLRNQLANALDNLKYEHDQRLQIERAYALADTVLRDVREWYRCPWKHGASVEVIDLQRHAEWIASLDAFLAGGGR